MSSLVLLRAISPNSALLLTYLEASALARASNGASTAELSVHAQGPRPSGSVVTWPAPSLEPRVWCRTHLLQCCKALVLTPREVPVSHVPQFPHLTNEFNDASSCNIWGLKMGF